MVKRDGAELRKERMQTIARSIQKSLTVNNGELTLSKTVLILSYDIGLSIPRVNEYLDILQGLGQFTIDREHDKIMKAKTE
jgi:hypothetical protein